MVLIPLTRLLLDHHLCQKIWITISENIAHICQYSPRRLASRAVCTNLVCNGGQGRISEVLFGFTTLPCTIIMYLLCLFYAFVTVLHPNQSSDSAGGHSVSTFYSGHSGAETAYKICKGIIGKHLEGECTSPATSRAYTYNAQALIRLGIHRAW